MKKYFSVLLLFSFSTATIAASSLQTDISAGYTYDDNVTRAGLDSDIEEDNILNIDGSAAYVFPVNHMSFFKLKGTLEINQYLEFSKLSNTRVGIHGSYHIRPGSGYTAFRYFARLSYEERIYDSDQRDGSATEIELGLSKRITDLLSLRAGYINIDVDANEFVFQTENDRFYIDLDYRLTKKNSLYITLGYQDGDLVSTADSTNNPQLFAELPTPKMNYWVVDDAFTDLTPTRWAYKLTGSTTYIRLGNNYAIDSKQAVDGSLFYYDSETDGGSTYSGLIFNVNYLYRF